MLWIVPAGFAQNERALDSFKPGAEYDNIHVMKIEEDSLQSTFVIWVKKSVKEHFHAEHTENLIVLEGKAEMKLGDSVFVISKGDYLNIPKGTPHAVLSVLSKKPLKVLSIQSPYFDGKDRVFVETKNKLK